MELVFSLNHAAKVTFGSALWKMICKMKRSCLTFIRILVKRRKEGNSHSLQALVSYTALESLVFQGAADGGQMFLYAWKGPLYVADSEEIVSCSECCREMAPDRSFQIKVTSKELSCRLDSFKNPRYQDVIEWQGWEPYIPEIILELVLFPCLLP